jgi:hypothetical protein
MVTVTVTAAAAPPAAAGHRPSHGASDGHESRSRCAGRRPGTGQAGVRSVQLDVLDFNGHTLPNAAGGCLDPPGNAPLAPTG